ncbi:MAG TPA: hypothetical protein P5107_02555 [Thermotogota bacterium]|nr:hypothetical protein [Thermotogota bacterium]HRW33919.1 hypothetical protein [Thermotogota bacterium]
MKKLIIAIWISFCFAVSFSDTLQELGSNSVGLLVSYSRLTADQIHEKLNEVPYHRMFMLNFADRKICALLLENEQMALYRVDDFRQVEDLEAEKAVWIYLQIQTSLFDQTDWKEPFSYTRLILDDMSYIDFFLNNSAIFQNEQFQTFKNNNKPDEVTHYIQHYHQLLTLFSNQMIRFFNDQEMDLKPTIYEEITERIPAAGYDFIQNEIESYHSQVQLLSFLEFYKDYQRGIYKQSGEFFADLPWATFFNKNTVENACRFQLNLDFLKYSAKQIDEYLTELNQVFSKSYGVMDIDALTTLLMKYVVFEIIAFEALDQFRTDAVPEAQSRFLRILINRDLHYDQIDDFLKSTLQQLKTNLIRSVSLLSVHDHAFRLVNALNQTKVQLSTSVTDDLIQHSFSSVELITPFEIPQENAHFAVVNTTVELSSDKQESFSKVYPVFPKQATKGAPIILLDFFHTAANHLTRTILLALRTIITNGFSLYKLEQEINTENVTISIQEYLRMEPFHELYQMKPTDEKRLKAQISNANIEYLALDNLFAGNIPKAILSEIEKTPSIEHFQLARYPIAYYSKETAITSNLEKNEKALIFVHGKQNIPYFDHQGDILPQIEAVWRNKGRMDVWNGFYTYVNEHTESFSNFDFYEFIYDTSVLDAQAYGQILAQILIDHSIHSAYDEIYIIASSMGGLVSRYCLNYSYPLQTPGESIRFGDYVKELITLDSPHMGTIAQNFILTINPALMEAVLKVKDDNPPNLELTLGNFIASFVNGTEAQKSAELMIYFARNHPEMVGKLFTEMLRFLDPFPGGMCMLYQDPDYCESLGVYLYYETENESFESVFVSDPPTNQLNQTDGYLDKLFLISGELTENATDITQGLSITYHLMRTIGDKLSHQTMENLSRHGRNDGVVNLYSQQMWGIDKGQQRYHFFDLDHLAIPRNNDVVEFIMNQRILKTHK